MRDDRYTYGHGFSMLFLSQVLGEEEDEARRKELIDVLTRAVEFTGQAQTDAGGWGYVSAKDGGDFRRRLDHDHASARPARLPQRRHPRAQGNHRQGGQVHPQLHAGRRRRAVQLQGGRRRPAITAAAIACLFNAGEYDDEYVPKLHEYCRRTI